MKENNPSTWERDPSDDFDPEETAPLRATPNFRCDENDQTVPFKQRDARFEYSFADPDEIATRFEKEWTAERSFSIEAALARVAPQKRVALFKELLAVDVRKGIAARVPVSSEEYKRRFPQFFALIDDVVKNEKNNLDSQIIIDSRVNTVVGGKYCISKPLGDGGMGAVYLASDASLGGRRVALKFVKPIKGSETLSYDYFKREAKTLGQINDPRIAQVYDYVADPNYPCFVMEFVEGVDLEYYLRKDKADPKKGHAPLTWRQAAEYAREIAKGLASLHEKKIYHRDLKPSNVMLLRDGSIRIIDLGLAKTGDEPDFDFVGTRAYASPEAQQRKVYDNARSDLYCLGGTFFFLGTGKLPTEWHNPDPQSADSKKPPKLLRDFAPDMPQDLFNILERLLKIDPQERYASAQDVARDLDDALGEDVANANRAKARLNKYKTNAARVALFLACACLLAALCKLWCSDKSDRTGAAPEQRGAAELQVNAKPLDEPAPYISSREVFTRALNLACEGKFQESEKELTNVVDSELSADERFDLFLTRGAARVRCAREANASLQEQEKFLVNAEKDLDAALKLEPNDPNLRIRLAELEIQLGERKPSERRAYVRRALELLERSPIGEPIESLLENLNIDKYDSFNDFFGRFHLDSKQEPERALRAAALFARAVVDLDELDNLYGRYAYAQEILYVAVDQGVLKNASTLDDEVFAKQTAAKSPLAARALNNYDAENDSPNDRCAQLRCRYENLGARAAEIAQILTNCADRLDDDALLNQAADALNADVDTLKKKNDLTETMAVKAFALEYVVAEEAFEVARLIPGATPEKKRALCHEQANARDRAWEIKRRRPSELNDWSIDYDAYLRLCDEMIDLDPKWEAPIKLRLKYARGFLEDVQKKNPYQDVEAPNELLPRIVKSLDAAAEADVDVDYSNDYAVAAVFARRQLELTEDAEMKERLWKIVEDCVESITRSVEGELEVEPFNLDDETWDSERVKEILDKLPRDSNNESENDDSIDL